MPPRRQRTSPQPEGQQPTSQPVAAEQPVPQNDVRTLLQNKDYAGLAKLALQADSFTNWETENKIPVQEVWPIVQQMANLDPAKTVGYLDADGQALLNTALPALSDQAKVFFLYNAIHYSAVNVVNQLVAADKRIYDKLLDGLPSARGRASFIIKMMSAPKIKDTIAYELIDLSPERTYNLFKQLSEEEGHKYSDDPTVQAQYADAVSKAVKSIYDRYSRAGTKFKLGIPEVVQDVVPETIEEAAGQTVKVSQPSPTFTKTTDALRYLLPEKAAPRRTLTPEEQQAEIELRAEEPRMASREAAQREPTEENYPGLTDYLKKQEEILTTKGVPAEKIPRILESNKWGFINRADEKTKGETQQQTQQQVTQDVRSTFQQKLSVSDGVPAQDVLATLSQLTNNRVDPKIAEMIGKQPTWNEASLRMLISTADSMTETASRFRGKFKPFNYMLGVDTEPGFVHSTVDNPNGFSLYLRWWSLPENIKAVEEKMRASQAGAHARDLKDVVGYMGVTPWMERKGDQVVKTMWALQEIQAPMLAAIESHADSKESNMVEDYFKDWYKILWNEAIKQGRDYNIDELWGVPSETIAAYWSREAGPYHDLRKARADAQKKLDSKSWMKAATPQQVAKMKEKASVYHPWERYYDLTPKALGADKIEIPEPIPYMGKSSSANKSFWRLKLKDVPKSKLARKMRLTRVAILARLAAMDIKSPAQYVDHLDKAGVLRDLLNRGPSGDKARQWIGETMRVLTPASRQMLANSADQITAEAEARGYVTVGNLLNQLIDEAASNLLKTARRTIRLSNYTLP